MNHAKTKAKKLNRTSSHRKALLANLSLALIQHEQIITTLPKAKFLRSHVEKLITLAKNNSLHNRRKALSLLNNQESHVKKLFDVIGPRYNSRNGGYTRIIKMGFRFGDAAPEAVIELVDRDVEARGKQA
ncbi:MAG: 50S ribosomal protein L17 [Sphingobacteriia bacterium]|nr:50S ribosomal protein L17 [Sphingobacteriia bacterium]